MGERKGQNFYYPADFDYKKHKSLNSYHGVHALRERANKIKEGILVIRFEMPFNVWCLGCNNHVGMGVRYNAEKKKIGMYYTTPLYEFRMKCHLCDNYYTIRTDPKNFDYEMVEGLRRQEKRFDPTTIDNLGAVDRTFNQKLAADAMFKKEHDADDKKKLESEETQIARLEWIQSRMYDDYSVNSYLRRSFRGEKKGLNEKRIADDDLKKRLSTSIRLQPESKDDRVMAKQMLKYKDSKSYEDRSKEARDELMNRPIFSDSSDTPSTSNDAKSIVTEQLRRKRPSFTTFQDANLKSGSKRHQETLGIILPGTSSANSSHRKTAVEIDAPSQPKKRDGIEVNARPNGSLSIIAGYESESSSEIE